MTQSPIQRYRALRKSGQLKPDAAQERATIALEKLHRELREHRPRGTGMLSSLFGGVNSATVPKGIYIHGDVGRGKSALMDLFFASITGSRKRRVHFNAFMIETHRRIHEWRNLSARERGARKEFVREAGDDPIAPVARRILLEAAVLCLDEFQVTDVADAMILGRLFEKLFAYGLVVVLTSNTMPEKLYEGGLNRQLFLPFIAMIKDRLDMIELNGPRDYRLQHMAGLNVYNAPLGATSSAAMDAAFDRLTAGRMATATSIEVMGRTLPVPQAVEGVARFPFAALCGKPLGAADYLALARNFHTILIDDIPRLSADDANEARRFTLLIDTLYDEKVKLVCSAAAAPHELYPSGDQSEGFRRAASRLVEMQSEDYLKVKPNPAALATVA